MDVYVTYKKPRFNVGHKFKGVWELRELKWSMVLPNNAKMIQQSIDFHKRSNQHYERNTLMYLVYVDNEEITNISIIK